MNVTAARADRGGRTDERAGRIRVTKNERTRAQAYLPKENERDCAMSRKQAEGERGRGIKGGYTYTTR